MTNSLLRKYLLLSLTAAASLLIVNIMSSVSNAVVSAQAGEDQQQRTVSEGDAERNTDCSENARPNPSEDALHPDNCGITRYIQLFTNGLSILVGVVVVMMIIVGGIRYSTAGSNPQAVASAKSHISQALLALAVYLFMFAFLQWIVPGGVL